MDCVSCKHWLAPDKDEWCLVRSVMGECKAAGFIPDMTTWDDEMQDTLLPEFADTPMAVSDSSGYSARFYTRPNFFCAAYKATKGGA